MIRKQWRAVFFLTFCCGVAVAQVTTTAPSVVAPVSTLAPSQVTAAPRAPGLQTQGQGQAQNPFLGSVPSVPPAAGPMELSLKDAIDLGLKYNLGLFLTSQGTVQARAARLRSLSDLLPKLDLRVAESVQQINLAALGFPLTAASRFGINTIAGPFSIFDVRGVLSESLDLKSLNNYRSAGENVRASQFSLQDARDLVVLVVGGTYIEVVSSAARVEAVQAQVITAQGLYQQAVDMKRAGTVAGIDVLRAQVELQVQQQRLVAAENDFEKLKLTLLREIGLPVGQQIILTDKMPYAPAPAINLEELIQRAYRSRGDYQAMIASRRAAELARKAAVGEGLPSIQLNADYGTLGNTPGNSHGTFTSAAALKVPLFQGGKVRAEIQQADALLRQREAEAEDMRGRIEFEVRSALLDVNAASRQVDVARSSVDLATQQLQQARDRFAAGVTNNIEVVQAQEALATTNENYVSSLFAHNFAKLSLARAVGIAEQAVKQFLGGVP
ncbi:MAG: TolC family protein [Terriglobales bacterium]